MFNITQVGNRVDIFSSGIDFRITGSLVTGTSFMMANIEAVGYDWDVTSVSGTLVNVSLIVSNFMLRNSFQKYSYDILNKTEAILDFNASKNASAIAGTVTLIHTNDGSISVEYIFPGSIIRNGDYIYLYYRATDTNPILCKSWNIRFQMELNLI